MIEITWGDFKNKIINEHRDDTWAYRGQASEKWQLESTLFRFISRSQKEIQAAGYYQILLSVLSNEKIKNENIAFYRSKNILLLIARRIDWYFHRKMKLIQRRAYGFRNFENYRLRVRVLCS